MEINNIVAAPQAKNVRTEADYKLMTTPSAERDALLARNGASIDIISSTVIQLITL